MRTVGIIAEYNPFHTGHEYQIDKAKRSANADYAVVVMSPDFVQRGEPAIFEKYDRAKMALLGGADLVIELPVCYASGSAEFFAEGAVEMLNALGVIDALCFGAETSDPDPQRFLTIASLLKEEPDSYKMFLRENLAGGMNFPQARTNAFVSCFGENAVSNQMELFSSPNNNLGVEYCRALLKSNSVIEPIPVTRLGSKHNSTTFCGSFSSAAAMRSSVCNGTSCTDYVPVSCRDLFDEVSSKPLLSEDFLPYLIDRFLTINKFENYWDMSPSLAGRLRDMRDECIGKTYEEIVMTLKTKELTSTRIRRALLHLILNIRQDDMESFLSNGTVYYANLLGFRETAVPLMHEIKKRSGVPLLTKTAQAQLIMSELDNSEQAKRMWEQDLYATHLYRAVQSMKYGKKYKNAYTSGPVKI